MKPTLALHRCYFFVVLWFTWWVGYIGFFRPQEIQRALPWPVPPFHARFIGALYLSATVFLLLGLFARSRLQARTLVDIAFAWTGWLLVISLLHWSSFDFAREQVWFWMVAYVSFPVAAAWLAWGGPPVTAPTGALMAQPWALAWLRVQGAVLVMLAVLLATVPGWVAGLWPWKISAFLAQVYSGPVLGYGVGSLLLAHRRRWPEALIPSIGMLVFALLALVASTMHLALFTAGSPSQVVWFASLGVLVIMSAALIAGAVRHGAGVHRATATLSVERA
jgi:hypothetical protein